MTILNKVILIDDDDVLNFINQTIIRKHFGSSPVEILSFNDPEKGLAYIASGETGEGENAFILLDINMPNLSGWDILERMQQLEYRLIKPFTTYILSSSIDPADYAAANNHPLVSGFMHKPLHHHLHRLFAQVPQRTAV